MSNSKVIKIERSRRTTIVGTHNGAEEIEYIFGATDATDDALKQEFEASPKEAEKAYQAIRSYYNTDVGAWVRTDEHEEPRPKGLRRRGGHGVLCQTIDGRWLAQVKFNSGLSGVEQWDAQSQSWV